MNRKLPILFCILSLGLIITLLQINTIDSSVNKSENSKNSIVNNEESIDSNKKYLIDKIQKEKFIAITYGTKINQNACKTLKSAAANGIPVILGSKTYENTDGKLGKIQFFYDEMIQLSQNMGKGKF